MKIYKERCLVSKNTFSIKPVRKLIAKYVDKNKLWIDPFANTSKIASVTNDLNINFDTDYHLEALDFLKLFNDKSIDGILFDPPYSPRQIKECYEGVGLTPPDGYTKSDYYSKLKYEISRIIKPGGLAITFGWNSNGIGMKYGFVQKEILIISHGGVHNDTIVVVEKKQSNLFDYFFKEV